MTGLSESPSPPESMAAQTILVVSTNWIGDCLMSLPALQAYRDSHPSCVIHVLCRPHLIPLWEMSGLADRIHPFARGTRALCSLGRQLRGCVFDVAYLFPNSTRSALAAWLSKAPERVGLSGHHRSWLLTRIVELPSATLDAHQCWESYDILGVNRPSDLTLLPTVQLKISDELADKAKCLMPGVADTWTGLIPCAARGPSKEWPQDHFTQFGRRLLEDADRKVVLFGGPGDAEHCETIREQMSGRALNLAGKTTIQEWAACMGRCREVVANDSGGMHLAAALGVPVVAIFGRTDPLKTGPLGTYTRVIHESNIADRQISRDSQAARDSLAAISVERVWDEWTHLHKDEEEEKMYE